MLYKMPHHLVSNFGKVFLVPVLLSVTVYNLQHWLYIYSTSYCCNDRQKWLEMQDQPWPIKGRLSFGMEIIAGFILARPVINTKSRFWLFR